MNKLKALLVGGATGGAGYLAWSASQSGLSTDPGDGLPVENGSLVLSDEAVVEAREGYIVGMDNEQYELGTAGAMQAVYDMAVEYTLQLTRLTAILADSMPSEQKVAFGESFRMTGHYNLELLTESQIAMANTMLDAAVFLGQSLRLLGYTYRLAGFERMWTPAHWQRRHIDLGTIKHSSFLNPMVHWIGPSEYIDGYSTVARPIQWVAVGWQIIREWHDAYAPHVGSTDQGMLEAGLREELAMVDSMAIAGTEEMEGTMGIALLVVPIVKIVVIAGVAVFGAWLVTEAAIEIAALFCNKNVGFIRAQADAYEAAQECAVDPDRTAEQRAECAALAAEIAETVESYSPGWSTAVTVGVLSLIGVGGYFTYRILT